MKELISQSEELKEIWKRAYELSLENSAALKPHLQNVSLSSINEAVETVYVWLNRSRAPSGFSPGFHLAKSLASVYMPSILSAAQNIEAGQYNHFPNFINALVNLLAAIHTMAVYAPKTDQSTVNADFTAELSQSLALLNTAQTELSKKISLLSEADEIYESIEKSHESISQIENELKTLKENTEGNAIDAAEKVEEVSGLLTNAKERNSEFETLVESHAAEYSERLDEITENYNELTEKNNEEYRGLLSSATTLNSNLVQMSQELEELQGKCKAQEEIIDSILPRGASAGLAAAFSSRVSQLNRSKWIWMTIFVITLITLASFALYLTTLDFPNTNEFWMHVVSRLPLAAPLVWLGWFSAIQYGNVIRVQEDYAFKEATSKAFQGYKDHMEHLGNVDIDEAQTALKLLSATTIEILGREPLRIYGNTQHDASPTHGLAKIFNQGKNSRGAESKESDLG